MCSDEQTVMHETHVLNRDLAYYTCMLLSCGNIRSVLHNKMGLGTKIVTMGLDVLKWTHELVRTSSDYEKLP